MSAKLMNQRLKGKGVQYYQDGLWVLYAKHQGKGYTRTKTHPYVDNHGELKTSISTVWEESGLKFLNSLI